MEEELTTINNNVSVMVHTPPPGTTAIAIRRAIAQTPAIVEKLEPIERSVFLASTAKVAQEYDDAELIAVMADTLKWIAKDIGIRDTESPNWKITIVRFGQILKRYYPLFSVKDIRMAFELMVTGELNDYLPKDRFGNPDKEHYQMFNADYFCKILNAYRVYRKAVINKAVEMVPKPVKQRNEAEERFYRNQTRKDIIAAFLFFKYRGYMPKLSPILEMLAYQDLAMVGLAEPFDVTPQEQQIILRRTLFELTQRQMIGDKKRVEQQGINAPDIQHGAYRLARLKALKRTFAEMVAEEIQITDYIKLENENGKQD